MTRRIGIGLAAMALLAWCSVASATWIDVEGIEPPAFEESPLGTVEAPWVIAAGAGCPNDNTQVYEGQQSCLVPLGTNVICNDVNLGEEGWYEFMFYDDMADSKNVRAGLHYAGCPYTAPRLGALAVETNVSDANGTGLTNYVAHRRWGFAVTTAPRSLGWRHMAINWYTGGVSMYVDGNLCMVFNDGYTYTALSEIAGAPYGNNSLTWLDSAPEPATLMLLGLGGLFLRRRRTA